MGCSKSGLIGKFIALKAHLKKLTKISNKQSTFILKETRKITTKNAKVSARQEVIKIRAEINKIESKKDTKDQ